MRKAVVTGASGFVGKYLLDELARQHYEVWAVVREAYRDGGCCLNAAHTVYCDLQNITALTGKIPDHGFDAFYHLAWEGSSGAKRADYALQLQNALACADAATASAVLGCRRFIGVGSVTELMYGDYLRQDGASPEMPVCYAVAKTAARDMSRCVCVSRGVDFLWGQIANFYGVGDKSQNIINYAAKAYLAQQAPAMTAGTQKADLLYVSDVAGALVAMEQRGSPSSIYYIGYGEPKPLSEFILQTRDAIDPSLPSGLGSKPFHGLDIDFDAIDVQKLHRDTGFAPEVCFDAGIRQTVQWIKSQ